MYVPGTVITISLSLQDGHSPLMLASINGHVKVVEMLLSKGAQVDLQDEVSMGGMERGWGDHMGGMESGWGDHMEGMERGWGDHMGGMESGWGDHMGGMERASYGRDGEGIIWERWRGHHMGEMERASYGRDGEGVG